MSNSRMPAALAIAAPRHLTNARRHTQPRRAVGGADIAGSLMVVVPFLLGAYLATGMPLFQLGMYGVCIVVVLPHIAPFAASLGRHPANLLLVLVFTALGISTCAVFARVPWAEATLEFKALAATAVWASIYVVVFSCVRTSDDVRRFIQWISFACLVITGSVYLAAAAHAVGISFGEVLEFRTGDIRVFGPLGDQVGFILVIPALMSLVASRPIMFAFHVGAVLMTATRGAAVCLVFGVLAYLVMVAFGRIRRNRSRMNRGVTTAAMIAIVAGIVWFTPVSTALVGRMLESAQDSGYSLRLTAIETGIKVFRDNLLLGVGFNGFANGRPAVADDWLNPLSAVNGLSRVANQYVQTATDGGAVALLLFVLFVICAGRNAFRVTGGREATPELLGLQLWLISVLAGNQGALWFLSSAASGYFIFAVAGLAARVSSMAAAEAAPRRRLGLL